MIKFQRSLIQALSNIFISILLACAALLCIERGASGSIVFLIEGALLTALTMFSFLVLFRRKYFAGLDENGVAVYRILHSHVYIPFAQIEWVKLPENGQAGTIAWRDHPKGRLRQAVLALKAMRPENSAHIRKAIYAARPDLISAPRPTISRLRPITIFAPQ